MQLTSTRVAAALALAFGILGSSTSHAVRPVPISEGTETFTPAWTPLGLSSRPVTVVVQLAGPSVAEQQAAAGRRLSRDEKDLAKVQLRGQHDAVRPQIESRGGEVVAQYSAAYNGMKVRIDSSRVSELATLPGVVAVRPLQLHKPDNVRGIPFIGAPTVWQNLGLHGEGVKVAIVDTGIDYTHANFGGPGTAAAYTNAHAHETAPADPALFGPAAPRVKGGTDLVGDAYDPEATLPDGSPDVAKRTPKPDPNPLDCNGHGSHVAGTSAGSGVLSDGTTYHGAYNANTVSGNSWNIGPGVAPKADLYAVRVFGCTGATDVVVDAIEWAVDHDMDVINMSLGSPFGSKDDPSAVASTNAARAGVVVIASAGNSGASQYIDGSPATADGAVSVAANDPTATFPGASLTFGGTTIPAIDANGFPLSGTTTYNIKVLTGANVLGCSVAAFGGPLPPNTIAVVNRGTCARVAKAIFGQQAGAAAVVMVNNAAGFPPFEGQITSNPDTGIPFTVTIPFLGVRGPATVATSDGAKLRATTATTLAVAPATLDNPTFRAFADFTSGGPRSGDSHLKPDITAPGVSISSTAVGTGSQAEILSGTSMAAPHVTGSAALTVQAHPRWSAADIRAAIVNTGSPAGVADYRTSRGGTGLVQPVGSTATQVVARAEGGQFATALNFGFAEPKRDFARTKDIVLRNNGSKDAIFKVAQANAAGSPHSVSLSRSMVRVRAHDDAEVSVTLSVPAATAGDSSDFREVAGLIEFTPASASDNAGVTLRVPYYFVPRPQSDVDTRIGRLTGTNPSTTATVTNKHGVIAGTADFYSWGLFDRPLADNDSDGEDGDNTSKPSNDVRAVGVQSFAFPSSTNPTRRLLVFSVNTYNRWSNASTNEFDIRVDVDGDGVDDYVIVGADQGAVQTGSFNGVMGSFVFSLRSGRGTINFLASAPTDSSTALLPITSTQLCLASTPTVTEACLSSANPRITYHAVSFDLLNGGSKTVAGTAKYNAFSSAVSDGGFVTVNPGATDTSNTISVNSAEFAVTPPLGVMVVNIDNQSGREEAQLIPIR
jgi:minor extracellular serine protease Vpr